MTIMVTAQPDASPPRNVVDVAVPAGRVMFSAAVWRSDENGRQLVRQQPATGFESRQVFDYEAPFGSPVTYDWEGAYFDGSTLTTVISEDFSTYPTGWTGDVARGSVSAGVLTLTGNTDSGTPQQVLRTVTPTSWDEIEVGALSGIGFLSGSLALLIAPQLDGLFLAIPSEGGRLRVWGRNGAFLGQSGTGWSQAEPFTIKRLSNGMSVTQGANTAMFSFTPGQLTGYGATVTFSNVATVGSISVSALVAPLVEVAESADPVTLAPDDAWLIAPQAPGLSFPLAKSDAARAGIASQNESSFESNATVHRILGARFPVVTTSGVRQGQQTTLQVRTVTDAERVALLALLDQDFPILLNVPADWESSVPFGFFQPGDVTMARVVNYGKLADREFTIPLTEVRSPITDVENTGWSYAELAASFASYADVRVAFSSYANLAAKIRS